MGGSTAPQRPLALRPVCLLPLSWPSMTSAPTTTAPPVPSPLRPASRWPQRKTWLSFIQLEPAVKFTATPAEDGFTVASDGFDAETSYALHVNKGLRGTIGGVLHEEYVNNVTFGKMRPSISFSGSKEVYLSGRGERNIAVRIVSVAKGKGGGIENIREQPACRREVWIRNPGTSPIQRRIHSRKGTETSRALGDVVYEKEVDTKTLPCSGNSRVLHVDLNDRPPGFQGVSITYHHPLRGRLLGSGTAAVSSRFPTLG